MNEPAQKPASRLSRLWLRLRPNLPLTATLVSGILFFISMGLLSRPHVPLRPDMLVPESPEYTVIQLPQVRVTALTRPAEFGSVWAAPVDPNQAAQYLGRVLIPAVQRYPIRFFPELGVGQIILCGQLQMYGRAAAGTVDYSGTIFVDVGSARIGAEFVADTFHHEVYHFVDRHTGMQYVDQEWQKLNLPGFQYGSGGVFALTEPTAGQLREELPGFVDSYSRSAMEEDKAEIFRVLMCNPGFVARQSTKDRVLAAKARLICARMEQLAPGTLNLSQLEAAGLKIDAPDSTTKSAIN